MLYRHHHFKKGELLLDSKHSSKAVDHPSNAFDIATIGKGANPAFFVYLLNK